MGNIYFSLINNTNAKKHIENIKNLIQNKDAALDVRGEENSPLIFIDIESHYNFISYIRRNSSSGLELVICEKNNSYNMVDIPMKDIESVYCLD